MHHNRHSQPLCELKYGWIKYIKNVFFHICEILGTLLDSLWLASFKKQAIKLVKDILIELSAVDLYPGFCLILLNDFIN